MNQFMQSEAADRDTLRNISTSALLSSFFIQAFKLKVNYYEVITALFLFALLFL